MNDLIFPPEPPDENDDLDGMTDDQLFEELRRCVILTVEKLRRGAGCVRRLESRGRDLSKLKSGLVRYVFLIAYGRLLPECVVKFVGSAELLDCVARLPPADQRRLADGAKVPLLVYAGDSRYATRKARPEDLTRQQRRQVFDKDGIRSESQQRLRLDDERTSSRRGPSRQDVDRAIVDRARKTAKLRGTYTLEELQRIVRALES